MKKKYNIIKLLIPIIALAIIIPITKYKLFFTPKKQKVVYVDMVADLFHSGHIHFLKQAKEFGNYLIVGLISDETCIEYKRRPILTLEERVKAVAACKYVDKVIPNAPLKITEDLIDENSISCVVHGDDFDKEKINYYYQAAIKRGIFKTVPYTKGISTTDIILRILNRKNEL